MEPEREQRVQQGETKGALKCRLLSVRLLVRLRGPTRGNRKIELIAPTTRRLPPLAVADSFGGVWLVDLDSNQD